MDEEDDKIMDLLKRLAELQGYFLELCYENGVDYTEYPLIMFEHQGTCIVNPFVDESGRFEVNPEEYYKESFLTSEWKDLLNRK